MIASATRESRGSYLHPQSNTRIHLLPRKSRIHCKVKYTFNVQRYNPAPLVLSTNSYRSLFQGTFLKCIWFHLAMLMTKKNISSTFPSLIHNPSSNLVTPFHVITHIPSSIGTPIPGSPSLGKVSSHWKVQKPRHIHALNHHNGHSMLMEINGRYWVPMALLLKWFTNMLLPVPILFADAANSCS